MVLLLLLGTAMASPAHGNRSLAQDDSALREEGQAIYLHGRLQDGGPITARARGDVALRGSQYACVNCHRRSGIGSSEGGIQIPPVIAETLFSPRISTLHDTYPSGGLHHESRPAYTTQSLGQALRHGIDPTGRELSSLMPRFILSEREVQALSAYLASLSVSTPPGIDGQEIHFATITTPGDEEAREALLAVLTTFFHDKNAGTRGESRRAQKAPYHKAWVYESYRRWRLHEWQLRGPEETWPAQLHALYQQQPVFAVLGGVGQGDWLPVHRFCEEQQLPCLMPQLPTPPGNADSDFYSLYFSRGVELEAQALARHLDEGFTGPQQIIQVRDHRHAAKAAAEQFRQALAGRERDTLTEVVVPPEKIPGADFWADLARQHPGAVWVLWLGEEALQQFNSLPASPAAIYVSASLQRDISALLQHPLQSHFSLLTPYRATANDKNTLRFRIWARVRELPVKDLHLQSSAFLATTLVGETLMHMRGNFSREYLLERMEHTIDNMINPSLYPRISLAPGQRYAAKGCYVWEMSKGFDTAQWIVP